MDCVCVNGSCVRCAIPCRRVDAKRNCTYALPHHTTQSGPGSELSRLLKRFGIEPTPTCACRAKAAEMDAWGPDECERPERIEEVVAVMRAEAEARGLPFVDFAAKLLIKRAIHNARKAAQEDKMK